MKALSIKIKFSLFLALLLLLTIAVLSLFVLQGIQGDQRTGREQELLQQTRAANATVKQAYLVSSPIEPRPFLRNQGQRLAMDLALYSGLHVALYDMNGELVGDSAPMSPSYDVRESLKFALQGKIAYGRQGETLLYLSPLQGPGGQMGVIQFHYSLTDDDRFYDRIARLFLSIGAIVLAVSFILGYLYFRSSASAVIRLNQAAGRIREGRFLQSPPLRRRDELGELSQGIYFMSSEIEKSMAAQRQFIGNISHEFKTPLTSIKAYAELMKMYRDDVSMQEDAVNRIELETERLYEMVEKTIRLAALNKFDFEFKAERVEIQPLLLEMIDRMQAKAERFGVSFATRLSPAVVWADRENMGHIFLNLLDNAVKYNVPGGRVTVSDRIEGGKVVIEVADTGIGIPEESRSRIFEPFYTANKDRSRQTGGTGLGLSLVKQLVEKQGGSIELADTDAPGTVFRIAFPSADK